MPASRRAAALVAAGAAVLSWFAIGAEPVPEADGNDTTSMPRAEATIWDGVYTAAQASRGQQVYPGPCGRCHGVRLDGAPDDPDMFSTRPIAGPKFLRDWDGRTVAALLQYVRTTMPENNPGFLSDGEYADLIAYMLYASGAPPGSSELPPDPSRLTGIAITSPR